MPNKLSPKLKKNLKDSLHYFNKASLNKGYSLFSNGGCRFSEYDPEENVFQFLVEGNEVPEYEVIIYGNETLIQEKWHSETNFFGMDGYYCECMAYMDYNHCKHIASAIYYLLERGPTYDDSLSGALEMPLEIDCKTDNVAAAILKHLDHKHQQAQYLNLENISAGKNSLKYELTDFHHTYELTIKAFKEHININCNYKKPYLTKIALAWFANRIQQYPQDLKFLKNTERKKIMQRVLDLHGLEKIEDKIENLFDVSFDGEELSVIPKGKLEGLYEPKMLCNFLGNKVFSPIEQWGSGALLDNGENENTDIFNPGIVLMVDSNNRSLIKIKLIKGKGTKKSPKLLKTKLSWLDDPEDFTLSYRRGLHELQSKIDRINRLFVKEKNDTNYLSTYSKILDLIDTSTIPLHILEIHGYYHDNKPRPSDLFPLDPIKASLSFKIDQVRGIYELQPLLTFGDQDYPFNEIKNHLELSEFYLIHKDSNYLFFDSPKAIKALTSFWAAPLIRFSEKNLKELEENLILPLSKNFTVSYPAGHMETKEPSSKPSKQLYISEMGNFVIFRPILRYENSMDSNPMEESTLIDHSNQIIYATDKDEENDYVTFLKGMHPSFEKQGSQGFLYLNFEEFLEDYWFLKVFENVKKVGVQVFGLDTLKNFRFSPHQAAVQFKLDTKPDWFEANLEVAFGNNKVRLKDLKKAVEQGSNYIELSDGTLGILPEQWLEKFGKLFRSSLQEKESLKVSKTHFDLIGELADPLEHKKILQEIAEKKEKLASFTKIEQTKPPKKLVASLRTYQQQGLNWLNFLKDYGWGGILADDMGLGKTLQLIALICQLKEHKKACNVLVVAPTTLLFNWKNELEKFAPHLDYFIHHGQRYDDPGEFSKHDLILTSYGVVINDIELLKQIKFELIVADESQAIKNISSLRHKALVQLKSNLKIALSGTPIENNIGELFAQMNFVNPGFFSTMAAFKRDYANKFKNGGDEALTVELRKKVAPFILRRTKEEVLTELPDKTEEYLYCEMGKTQRKLYDAYRNEYRDFLLKKFEEDGPENSKMYVLEGLTRLRQICDATALVKNGEENQESAKIDLLLEHILEKTGEHKILIFSQFVKMLEQITKKLAEKQVSYVYLDGKTSMKERENRVNHFQENEDTRVFLISLKAGGTGLNLTAADYVYIVDPWWNPATENQAIDRCYRMGQKKNVFAYRMICKNSVEEKIIQLQEAKKKLSKEVIGEGESILSELNRDSLLELFD
ncbi:DEAD/DEAH box helicase [Echinicola marina]|uniref:DEAD/DEAH box helicase n=1 Tax=Echinicola marina TaxID=2859768 RepID=UPI001CF61718|nr:DEAD/DEAH box helicase [Echinicola marina]UCS94762.1 DEAD/DEAH box helicase [Echinicola marina]